MWRQMVPTLPVLIAALVLLSRIDPLTQTPPLIWPMLFVRLFFVVRAQLRTDVAVRVCPTCITERCKITVRSLPESGGREDCGKTTGQLSDVST